MAPGAGGEGQHQSWEKVIEIGHEEVTLAFSFGKEGQWGAGGRGSSKWLGTGSGSQVVRDSEWGELFRRP